MTTLSRHTATVTLGTVTLSPSSGSITMDASWSPFVQGSCQFPFSAELDALDPRQSPPPRVRVNARQVFGESALASEVSAEHAGKTAAEISTEYAGYTAAEMSGEYFTGWNVFGVRGSTSRSFDLSVREKSTDEAAQEITLELASDEALLQDFALVSTEPRVLQSTSVRTIVSMVLSAAGFRLTPGTVTATIEGDSAVWEPGVSGWDFLAPYVQQAGLRLWADGNRAWHLELAETLPTGHATLDAAASITDAKSTISRAGDWADAVVIKYTWTDALGVDHVRYDVAGKSKPTKVVTLTYEQKYPGPGAAAHVLRRKSGLGELIPVSAISGYDIEPGYSFTLALQGRPDRTGTIEAVEWSWPDDQMNITTRDIITP